MGQYVFGAGELWGVRTDVANSTPMKFGVLQEVNFDISASVKALHGQYRDPVAVAPGTRTITGKIKNAQINARIFNDLFLGGTLTTPAQLKVGDEEAGTIPTTPFAVTVTNSATFVDDLGVINPTTRAAYTKVSGSPTTGQYSVSAGVYTFAAADTGLAVKISYTYTVTSAGYKIVVGSALLGAAPIFQLVHSGLWNTQYLTFKWHQVIASKLTFGAKNEDWTVPEMDFSCFQDSSGNLVTISTVE